MTTKRDSRGRKRNYDKEYTRDHKPKKDKGDRSSRNRARTKLNKWRRSHGKQVLAKTETVDHQDGNPKNNSSGNLKVMSQGKNSAKSNKKRAKKSYA
tara:strand:+ start:23 stop:313 length:291 start_codon:yes stop_codon:yes gene_type:complete